MLDYDAGLTLRALTLHPFNWGPASTTFSMPPAGQLMGAGIPVMADGRLAEQIVGHVRDLSATFGTRIVFDGGAGRVVLD